MHERRWMAGPLRRLRLSPTGFVLVIIAGVVWAVVESFGPVKLLGVTLALIGANGLRQDIRSYGSFYRRDS